MEESSWKDQLMPLLRKPATILALVLLLGLGADLAFVIAEVLPLASQNALLRKQASQVESQVHFQENRPIPAKVKASDFDALLKQVPVSTGLPEFLLELHAAEAASGIVLSNLASAGAGGAAKEDDLLSALAGQSKASSASPGPQPSVTPKSAASPAPSGFTATSLTLQLKGTYEQMRDFVTRLYQMERVVSIRQWQYTANGASDAVSSTAVDKGGALPLQPIVQMTMTLDIYNAKSYASQLQDPPSAIQPQPALREDPTMMDERFQKLLESLSTTVVK